MDQRPEPLWRVCDCSDPPEFVRVSVCWLGGVDCVCAGGVDTVGVWTGADDDELPELFVEPDGVGLADVVVGLAERVRPLSRDDPAFERVRVARVAGAEPLPEDAPPPVMITGTTPSSDGA